KRYLARTSSTDAFFVGFYSILEPILDEKYRNNVCLSRKARAALSEHKGKLGVLLHLVESCENGDDSQCQQLANKLNIDYDKYLDYKQQASAWAHQANQLENCLIGV
ncbi:MAG: hypothetical protein ACPHV3_05910, partial [Vibrio sp.]